MVSNIFLESAQRGAHFYMYRTVEIRNFKILKNLNFKKPMLTVHRSNRNLKVSTNLSFMNIIQYMVWSITFEITTYLQSFYIYSED